MRQAKKLRDDRIKELEDELRRMIELIANLEKRILQLEAQLMAGPKVERVADVEKVEFVYQEDPVLKRRNQQLIDELDKMMVTIVFNQSTSSHSRTQSSKPRTPNPSMIF